MREVIYIYPKESLAEFKQRVKDRKIILELKYKTLVTGGIIEESIVGWNQFQRTEAKASFVVHLIEK